MLKIKHILTEGVKKSSVNNAPYIGDTMSLRTRSFLCAKLGLDASVDNVIIARALFLDYFRTKGYIAEVTKILQLDNAEETEETETETKTEETEEKK